MEQTSRRVVAIKRTNISIIPGLEVEYLLSVTKQEKGDCAVQSNINCFRQLDNIGKLTNAAVVVALRGDLPLLYQQLSILEAANIKNLLLQKSASTHNVGREQSILREKMFEQNGFKVERLLGLSRKQVVNKFLNAIRDRSPIIIDVDVKVSDARFLKYQDGKLNSKVTRWLYPTLSDDPQNLGGHSVLAVGFIQERASSWFRNEEGLVIVLDSASGSFALWPLGELRKFTRYATIIR